MEENTDAVPEERPEPETHLTRLFGNHPKVRILAALFSDSELDHNITEIADLAGVSRNTVYRHRDDLLDTGVVVRTRNTGGSDRYRINTRSDTTTHLKELLADLAEEQPDSL